MVKEKSSIAFPYTAACCELGLWPQAKSSGEGKEAAESSEGTISVDIQPFGEQSWNHEATPLSRPDLGNVSAGYGCVCV